MKNKIKKNCLSCKYLEYYSAGYEESGGSGYFCNKRESKNGSEDELLRALDTKSYREKSKVCHEPTLGAALDSAFDTLYDGEVTNAK